MHDVNLKNNNSILHQLEFPSLLQARAVQSAARGWFLCIHSVPTVSLTLLVNESILKLVIVIAVGVKLYTTQLYIGLIVSHPCCIHVQYVRFCNMRNHVIYAINSINIIWRIALNVTVELLWPRDISTIFVNKMSIVAGESATIQRTVRTAHLSVLMTVHNFQYTIQHRTVLIISPLTSRQSSQLRCCLSEEKGDQSCTTAMALFIPCKMQWKGERNV